MENFKKFALDRKAAQQIKGGTIRSYTITTTGPGGTYVTTVTFNDANDNYEWDANEMGNESTTFFPTDSELPIEP